MPTEPIEAVALMRSIRRELDERYRGLALAARVAQMQEELREHPLGRRSGGVRSPGAAPTK